MPKLPACPSDFIRIEADGLRLLADRLDAEMGSRIEEALAMMAGRTALGNRIAVTGVGKSGLIARKIAATLASTGTPAWFLHPVDALHGDLGMLVPGDVVIALSYSGETDELLRLLPAFQRIEVPVIAFTGCVRSTLGKGAAVTLDVSVDMEACSLNLAPTASTTVMLALGDALALELARRSGFASQHFADLHPGGRLGRRFARVRDLMHSGEDLPRVAPETQMTQVIHEMSHKKLGMTSVLIPARGHADAYSLAGIISDGDLRRLLETSGTHALERTAGEIMNPTPRTIAPSAFASQALEEMEARRITSLVVVDDGLVVGVIHMHDLFR
jgi:arabinose-5-phosphate isomerase